MRSSSATGWKPRFHVSQYIALREIPLGDDTVTFKSGRNRKENVVGVQSSSALYARLPAQRCATSCTFCPVVPARPGAPGSPAGKIQCGGDKHLAELPHGPGKAWCSRLPGKMECQGDKHFCARHKLRVRKAAQLLEITSIG